ncbi:TPA: VipD [Legionella pneumophila]|nr:VipD [Legionella pneumophila]
MRLAVIMTKSRKLKRNLLEISKTEAGQYSVTAPEHKGLVLSGGGAKGISYLGMIQALQERGKIKNLTHVSGASAGAMTASILAVGMDIKDIKKLIEGLDITKLLDNSGVGFRARGDRFRNILDVIYMMQMKKHLESVQQPIPPEQQMNYGILKQKIALYEDKLSRAGIVINNVDDIINLTKSVKDLEKLDKALNSIPTELKGAKGEQLENPRITLGDLGRLRELLPEENKHLIKNLSVVVTNQTKHELERYSEDSTPQQSIAQVVQWSGAHPVLFVPGRNAKGEYIADGGILDNMPEIEGLDREEVLCVKAEAGTAFEDRVNKAKQSAMEAISWFKARMDSLVEATIGGKWLHATSSVLNREKVYYNIDNMIYINTGEVTTTNTSPTPEQRARAVKNGYDQTMQLLDSHKQTFDHPLMAILYIGHDKLKDALIDEKSEKEIFEASAHAQAILHLQEQIVKEMNDGDYNSVQNYLDQIEDILTVDAKMDDIQKEKAFALCIKQVNFLSEGKLGTYLNKVEAEAKAAAEPSWATKILNLLWAPIEWVVSLFKGPAQDFKVEVQPEPVKVSTPENQETVSNQKDINPAIEYRKIMTEGRREHTDPSPSLQEKESVGLSTTFGGH